LKGFTAHGAGAGDGDKDGSELPERRRRQDFAEED
jgi:hypothetical protein